MKKALFLFLILPALAVQAQKAKKPPKPSITRADRALNEGKLDVAKSIIDVTVTDPKFASDARAWYVRGVIYASLDTTSNPTFKALDQNPFAIAKESFGKADQFKNPQKSVFTSDIATGLPILPEQTKPLFAQKYFDKGLKFYQEENNYKAAFENVEKAAFFVPQDTSVLLNVGLFFAPGAEEYDKAIDYLRKYLSEGGKSTDAYTMLFSIYRDKKSDNEGALQVAKDAAAAHPDNEDFPKYEIDIYVKTDRLDEARKSMEKQLEHNPGDVHTMYLLGVISHDMKDYKQARVWYEKTLAADPKNVDAHIALAELVYQEARDIKGQMNALGISKEDRHKRLELDKALVEKLKVALPYWEACEKLDPENSKVLDSLHSIYTNLGMDSQIDRVEKIMKSLGIL